MRIAVVGPQNTGKSTFVKDFVAQFPKYYTPKETYRDVIQNNELRVNQDTSEEAQEKIAEFMIKSINFNEDKNVIFDRCLIDNYVYTLCAHENNNASRGFVDKIKRLMLEQLDYIDMIFFIPTSVAVKLESDELRDTDPYFIDQVNRNFLNALFLVSSVSHIPIHIIAGKREKRIALAESILF